jgi:excinuclease ABC subunit C
MGIDVPVFGMVKDNKHRTRAIAASGGEISVSDIKPAFFLLTRIQDEVHRFAISYQRSKHEKKSYELELTKVKGIGIKKAQKLILKYRTKSALKEATPEELAETAGVSIEIGRNLYDFIQSSF